MLALLLLVVNQSGLGLPGAADLCRLASQAPGAKLTIALVGFSWFILIAVALWMRAQRADGRAMRSPLWLLACAVPGVLAGFVARRFIAAHPTDSLGEIEVGASASLAYFVFVCALIAALTGLAWTAASLAFPPRDPT